MNDIEKIRSALQSFANERDWDQFHTPKNLALALTAEVGELIEHFQWDTPEQIGKYDAAKKSMIADEMADVLWVLVCLANQTGVDLEDAIQKNIAKKTQRDKNRHKNNQKLSK